MKTAPAKQVLARRRRREFGLEPEDEVRSVWRGPPNLALDRREELLRSIRNHLDSHGYTIWSVDSGTMFRRARTPSSGEAATQVLDDDEQRASESQGHWWVHDATWRRGSSSSFVHFRHDFDGNDLSFVVWGPETTETIIGIEQLLEAHQPRSS